MRVCIFNTIIIIYVNILQKWRLKVIKSHIKFRNCRSDMLYLQCNKFRPESYTLISAKSKQCWIKEVILPKYKTEYYLSRIRRKRQLYSKTNSKL